MSARQPIDPERIRWWVREALREDRVADDCTVAYLQIGERTVRADIMARESGVVAGVDVARSVFAETDPGIVADAKVGDGARVEAGGVVLELYGSARGILGGERVALNFLQRLSGVATLTARFVEAVRGTGVRILDTRKTTPLLRELEKYAVRMGGGENHRHDLGEMILIKENHFRVLGGAEALRRAQTRAKPARPVSVEADTPAVVPDLLGLPVDRILLDNFSPEAAEAAVRLIREHRQREPSFSPRIEISGGITLENVRRYAATGVDFISIGRLTHSAPALDMSLEVRPDGR